MQEGTFPLGCNNGWRHSGAPRAKCASVALWINKSTHPRKFGNHVTAWPSDRPSTPQAYQCLLSHFLATLGAQEKADCTSMLLSIDSCQNKVSADQYHLTVSRAQVSTHQGRVFFEVIRWQCSRFQMTAGSDFLKFISNMLCLCHYRPALLRFWFQTDLRRKNSPSFIKIPAGKTFSYHGQVLVTLHVQFLCPDWLKFDRWLYA